MEGTVLVEAIVSFVPVYPNMPLLLSLLPDPATPIQLRPAAPLALPPTFIAKLLFAFQKAYGLLVLAYKFTRTL